MKKKRIDYIDFLKCIGLAGIIIAHVDSPNSMIMIRSFDVPLMVILSSLLASHSIQKYSTNFKSIFSYYVSRFKRLVFPTWIFLIFYFCLKYLFTREFYPFPFYRDTFLLTRYGLGFVWIILIYLYSAFLIPVFRSLGFHKKSILIVCGIYILYEVFYHFKIGINNRFIDTTFYYIIPYGFLTFLGYHYESFKPKMKNILFFMSTLLFIGLAVYYYVRTGSFQLVSIAKYPPRVYYLSYGVMMSILLMIICHKYHFKIFQNPLIVYVSKHSMWIYLWHILVLDVYSYFHLPEIWFLKFLLVSIGSILIVFITNKLFDRIEKKKKIPFLSYLR